MLAKSVSGLANHLERESSASEDRHEDFSSQSIGGLDRATQPDTRVAEIDVEHE